MTDPAPSIDFECAVSQVRTLADGGIRVQLDLPEDAITQAAYLMQCKRAGIYLRLLAVEKQNAIQEGRKRKSKGQTEEGDGD